MPLAASAADRSEREAARRAKRTVGYDARQVKQSPTSSQDDYAARASDNDPSVLTAKFASFSGGLWANFAGERTLAIHCF
jgi:hypothetical protein